MKQSLLNKVMKGLLLLLPLISMNLSAQIVYTEFTLIGSGTEADPYQIGSNLDLLVFKNKVEMISASLCGKLVNNIDMGAPIEIGTDTYYIQWWPINNNREPYSGVFDGNSCSITFPSSSTGGLFVKSSGIIKNVNVLGNLKQFGICEYNTGTIYNCKSYADIVGNGGICISNSGTVMNCENHGEVSSYDVIGGICCNNSGDIINCVNYGMVKSSGESGSGIGGICGGHYKGMVENCNNYGTVITYDRRAGGIVGIGSPSDDLGTYPTIKDCNNYGNVSTQRKGTIHNDALGGIAGESSMQIINCSNHGTISGGDQMGGIVGYNSHYSYYWWNGFVESCTNYGNVITTGPYNGGIAGLNEGIIRECTNKGNIDGGKFTGGIVGSGGLVYNCRVENVQIKGAEYTAAIIGKVDSDVRELDNDEIGILGAPLENNFYTKETIVQCNDNIYNGITERGVWVRNNDPLLMDVRVMYDWNKEHTYHNGAVMKGRITVEGNPNITITGVPDIQPGDDPDVSGIIVKYGETTLEAGSDYNIVVDSDNGTIIVVFTGEYEGDIVVAGTTAIDSIIDEEGKKTSNQETYTLDGRKVTNSALKNGIYIRNGKKILIK